MSDARGLIIVGTGGHSRIAIDIALLSGRRVSGLIDLHFHQAGETIMGVSVMGGPDRLAGVDPGQQDLFIAIGDNGSRRNWFEEVSRRGYHVASLIHPAAIVSGFTKICHGVLINAGAILNAGAVINANTIINTGAIIDHETIIGRHCHIAPASTIAGRVTVGDNSFIGAGSTIIDKITIGQSAVIGAGSVVIRNIPSNQRVAGIPAKPL